MGGEGWEEGRRERKKGGRRNEGTRGKEREGEREGVNESINACESHCKAGLDVTCKVVQNDIIVYSCNVIYR